jgi:hypothetical protein
MALTQLQAETTQTATYNGSAVAISSLTLPCEVQITVDGLTSNNTAILELQTSTDSSPFTSDIRVEKTFNFYGSLASTYPQTVTVHDYNLPGFRAGVANAHARIVLNYIDSGASVSYSAWIQN